MIKYFYSSLLVIALVGAFTSCVDNAIDEPPVKDVPVLETNATVQDILDIWVSGDITEITDDLVLDAVVIADDEFGNFFKNVVIEDETAGITIRIEANNIYAALPIGRRVYVKAQGLFVGDFAGLPQIGFGEDEEGDMLTIPFALIGEEDQSVIVPAERDQEITPTTVKINEIGFEHLSTLIKIEDVQFVEDDLGLTYADATNLAVGERFLTDCDGNQIMVRTSGFSDFADETLPSGNGDIVVVYNVFNSTKQLALRDISDVDLNGDRCGEVVVEVPDPNATIGDVLALYTEGSVTAISTDLIFDGIVTANDISGNFFRQIVIEDENDAINIQIDDFDLFQDYELGRRVVVKAQNLAVGDFNGLPQIGQNSGSEVSRLSATVYPSVILPAELAGEVSPTVVTVDDVINGDFYNKLIRLEDVEFADEVLGDTYADADNMFSFNHDVVDCDGEAVILRSSGFSDFADVQVAEGNGTLTAIFSVFSGTKQLIIRKVQDVSFNGERCDGGGGNPGVLESLDEDFETVGDGQDVSLSGWSNVATAGTRVWRGNEFSGNTYAQATAFNDTEPSMETWLISPVVKMNGENELSFRSATAFYTHDGLTVLISTDYDDNPTTATWTELNPTLAGSAQGNYDWVESGTIDLSSYDTEEIVIGFRYVGAGSGNTCTFIVDDVVITN